MPNAIDRRPLPCIIEALDDNGLEAIQKNFEAIFSENTTGFRIVELEAALTLIEAGARFFVIVNSDGTIGLQSLAIPVTDGGTGHIVYVVGDILAADTTTSLARIADVATGNALLSGGVGVLPAYGKIGLTTHVSGILPVESGGTEVTTLAVNGVLYGNTQGPVLVTAQGAANTVLVANAGAPAFSAAVTVGTSVSSPSLVATTAVTTPSIVTASGALTITPAAGSGLSIALSTTGDFAINTDDFYLDTSTGQIGMGTVTPDFAGDSGQVFTLSGGASRGKMELGTTAADADAVLTGELKFSSTSNNVVLGDQKIASIQAYVQGTTANKRGGKLLFLTKTDNTSSTVERLTINNIGNIGINQPTPTRLLEVRSLLGDDGIHINADNSGGVPSLKLTTTATSGGNVRNWLFATNYDVAGDFSLRCSNAEGGNPYSAGTTRFLVNRDGNLGLGVTTFGASAAKVMCIGNGAEPTTSPADVIQLYSVDLSAGNATLGLRTETAVVTETVTSDRTLSVRINGTTYKICLKV